MTEDYGKTYDSLLNKDLLKEILNRVSQLTNREEESYSDNIERISLDTVTHEVKMADRR